MDIYYLWVCCGCDSATFQIDADVNGFGPETDFYPRRSSNNRSVKQFLQLKENLKSVYREVIECFNARLRLTCAMGLRALLEGICIDRGILDKEAWGLEAKLDKLDEGKHLPSNIVESLHSFKFLGDHAAHRLEAPKQDELELAVDVMEDLLNYLYEREYSLTTKAKKLAEKREAEINRVKQRKVKREKRSPDKS